VKKYRFFEQRSKNGRTTIEQTKKQLKIHIAQNDDK